MDYAKNKSIIFYLKLKVKTKIHQATSIDFVRGLELKVWTIFYIY